MFENQNTTKSVDAQDDDGSDGSSTLPGSTKQALLLDYLGRSVFIYCTEEREFGLFEWIKTAAKIR